MDQIPFGKKNEKQNPAKQRIYMFIDLGLQKKKKKKNNFDIVKTKQ
jgi:hypothetical protein